MFHLWDLIGGGRSHLPKKRTGGLVFLFVGFWFLTSRRFVIHPTAIWRIFTHPKIHGTKTMFRKKPASSKKERVNGVVDCYDRSHQVPKL